MGRRSDHNREQLAALILAAGIDLMAEVGLARFSAREVAKRIGYTIGTIHNVYGGYDPLVTAINTTTFGRWTEQLRARLQCSSGDRIETLVRGYFEFARDNRNLWQAIFDHHLPDGADLPEAEHVARGVLTTLVVDEVATALARPVDADVGALARSLIATVHGHCAFALSGAWALMGEAEPERAALLRVREILAAACERC